MHANVSVSVTVTVNVSVSVSQAIHESIKVKFVACPTETRSPQGHRRAGAEGAQRQIDVASAGISAVSPSD